MMKSTKFLVLGIFLFMQGCSLGNFPITPIESTPLTGTSEGGIVILSSSGFFDSYRGYHVVGEIVNNLSTGAKSIQLQLSLFDSSGFSLLRDESGNIVESLIFFTQFDSLDIGEKSPFFYYFDLYGGIPASYQVAVVDYETTTIKRPIWTRENVQIFDNGDGYYTLTGEIVNLSPEWVSINNLIGGVRDDAGTVLSVETIATYVSTLAPAGDITQRDRTPFSIKVPIPSGSATQWDVWCETEYQTEIVDYPLVIETEGIYLDEFHSLHYIGTVTNNSDVILSSPIVVGLFTADGSVLDVSYLLPVVSVPAGMSLPFEITNFGSYEWTDERIGLITGYRANIDPGKTESIINITELQVENETINKMGLTWSIHGSFSNASAQSLEKVTALISVYSIDDTLIAMGYGFSYPAEGKFAPGTTGEYDVTVYLPADIDTSNLVTKTILLADVSE